jgi:exonuclease III
VVKMLEKKGIVSLYHFYFNQTQGMEQHPTFYMYRHKNKAYHIDYCFVSNEIINKLNSFEIGGFDDWIKHSDHAPLITTFDF